MSTRIHPAETEKAASVIEVLDAKVRPKPKARRYDYWLETHRPLACLAFIAPFLLWYEVSMILHPDTVRSGIDRLVQHFLWPLGDVSFALLPLATIGSILFLHHRQKDQESFQLQTIFWMAFESLALAFILFLACDAMMLYWDNQRPQPLAGLGTAFSDPKQYGRVMTCLGAGIHEELVFRLFLFAPFLFWLNQKLPSESMALVLAAGLVSLIFATAHCDVFNPEGFPFQLSTFLFRFLASVFLCMLFRFRGIGIAIGVHAIFDILAIS